MSNITLYLLCGTDGQGRIRGTYVGITTDLARRLRQHNGELVGGAKSTTRRSHLSWSVAVEVRNFPDDRSARQLEWRLHRAARRRSRGGCPLVVRLGQLRETLGMKRWTSTALEMGAVVAEHGPSAKLVLVLRHRAAAEIEWPTEVVVPTHATDTNSSSNNDSLEAEPTGL